LNHSKSCRAGKFKNDWSENFPAYSK